MAQEPLYKINPDHASLHVSKGNSKIGKGIWSFSTLPGNEDHLLVTSTHGLLTNIPGTCSKYCDGCFNGGCYAVRDAKLHHNATIPAWAENTLLLRSGRLWEEVDTFLTLKNGKALKYLRGTPYDASDDAAELEQYLAVARGLAVVKYFRIHVSGELENAEQLRRWNQIARQHPETTFGIYTKNYDALAEFLDDEPEGFANNLVVNVSEWHGVAKPFLEKYAWAKLNVFVYDDHVEPDVAKLPHCPAVTKEGHHTILPDGSPMTCDRCGRCYRKTGERTAVHAH
ncbi:MAG: hypothetical protein II008_06825 [Oscillospiraceae bacterium]|nr:hypothetical protein [Oscillospiraceae bacterium]